MAAQATAYFGSASEVLLTDLVVAETIYVLESFYKTPRQQIAEAMRSLIAFGRSSPWPRPYYCGPSRYTRLIGSTSPRPT